MADQLSVELFINDSQADIVLAKQKTKLENYQKEIAKINPTLFGDSAKRAFEIETATRRTLDNRGNSLDALQNSAVKLKTEITTIRSQIKSLNESAASKSTNSIFNKYEVEAEKLNKQLIQAEYKLKQLDGIRGKNFASGSGKFFSTAKGFAGNAAGDFAAGFGLPVEAAALIEGKITALSAATVASIAAIGTLAAAGFAVVKYSESVRAEAERRLKLEEQITAEYGRQVSKGFEIVRNFKEQRELASRDRSFGGFLQNSDIEELKRNRDLLQKLFNLNPTGANAAEFSSRILALDSRISAIPQEQQAAQDRAAMARWERFKKLQDDAVRQRGDAEKRQIEAAEKFNKSVEQGKEKVKDLGKTYASVFEGLAARANGDNPFVRLFSDAERSMKSLRDNTKGLSSDLIKSAEEMERTINQKNLFALRLDNQLGASDLRASANSFRNPFDASKVQKQQNEFIDRFLFNNPNYLFLQGKTELDDATRSDILRRGSFDSLEKRRNDDLERQRNLLFNPSFSAEQQAAADRKFIGLTSGVNPLELSENLRESAALAREREAERLLKAEGEAQQIRVKDLEIQTQIRDEIKKLNSIAEKEGLSGVESLIRIVDETGGKVRIGKTPNQSDTANFMKQ